MTSIPTHCGLKQDSPFDDIGFDKGKGGPVHKLNLSKLADGHCHIFYPIQPIEETLIIATLEHLAFHPNHPKLNEQFNFAIVKCGKISLNWCSFPSRFKEVCERIARVYGMKMINESRMMVLAGGKTNTIVEMPRDEKVFIFQGNRRRDNAAILREVENVIWFANKLDALGID